MTPPSLSSARRAAIWVLAGVAALAAPLSARSQALLKPDESGPWTKKIQVDLFASLSYTYNDNHPDSDLNGYRIFDFESDAAKLDVLSLAVQKAAASQGEFGFRMDLAGGQSLPEITAASGLFRNVETGEASHFDIEQAYVSYVAKAGRGLRFDLGKFFAPVGYESIDRYDAYNDNFSRSFLFGFSAPFTNTGLRISYPFSDQVSGSVMVVQGWDNVCDNNTGKTIGAQVVVTPVDPLALTLNYIGGPEQDSNNSNWRNVIDFCATWKATNALTLGLNVDDGYERGALASGASARWYGAALYAVYGFTDRFGLALRAERLDDCDGARTGTPQRLEEITLTPSYKIGGHLLVRADFRQDWSNRPVFQKGGGFTDRQFTAALNLLVIF